MKLFIKEFYKPAKVIICKYYPQNDVLYYAVNERDLYFTAKYNINIGQTFSWEPPIMLNGQWIGKTISNQEIPKIQFWDELPRLKKRLKENGIQL